MPRITLLVLVLCFAQVSAFAQPKITPSHVFVQAKYIENELKLILRHFKQPTTLTSKKLVAAFKPRHAWQQTYVVLTKLNVFRKKQDLPGFAVNGMEPVLDLDPLLVYEQTQRILTELRILKTRLAIRTTASVPPFVSGKKPIDVFNQLSHVSLLLEELNNETISPTYVFAEAMRAYEDSTMILMASHIEDTSYPPGKVSNVTPAQSLSSTFELMDEIQRLQKSAKIPITDFSPFRHLTEITPADVYNMVGMCLAELQTLKAYDHINSPTPAAEYHEAKIPADVNQLIQWTVRKLKLIKEIR